MKIMLRRSLERGYAEHGWLKSYHSFSFADYHDPQFMGFGKLKVINEDYIVGGAGFATHGHRNMEIVTYMIRGALRHRDSMGDEAVINVGEVQRMSAGSGVRHSEHNAHSDQEAHLLQIWILPAQEEMPPSYSQKSFASELKSNNLILVASRDAREGSVQIHQNVDIFACRAEVSDGSHQHKTQNKNHVWIQVISGEVTANDVVPKSGDGLGVTEAEALNLKWILGSEFLLFDMKP